MLRPMVLRDVDVQRQAVESIDSHAVGEVLLSRHLWFAFRTFYTEDLDFFPWTTLLCCTSNTTDEYEFQPGV